jgi:hypothetical protein
MAHQRTTIREALISRLTGTAPNYATVAGARIYSNRPYNLGQPKLPAIIVRDDEETAVPRDMRLSPYIRTWKVRIELHLDGTTDYDTDLDDFAKQVEDLMAQDRTMGGTAVAVKYSSNEPSFEQGDKVIAKAILTYEFTYIA